MGAGQADQQLPPLATDHHCHRGQSIQVYTSRDSHREKETALCRFILCMSSLATIVDKNSQAPKFLNYYRAHGKPKTTTIFPVQCTICLFCAICMLYKLDLCKLGGYFACTMDRTRHPLISMAFQDHLTITLQYLGYHEGPNLL